LKLVVRTAQAKGYSNDQLQRLCQTRAATLRAKADEIEQMA